MSAAATSKETFVKPAILQEGRYRFSVAHLLVAIVLLFIVVPFSNRFAYGRAVETIAFTLVMLAGVNAVGGRKSMWAAAALWATPAIAARWVSHVWPQPFIVDLYLIAAAAFVIFVINHLLRFVVRAPQVNEEVLCASISIYLLFAVAWAFGYSLLARWDPTAVAFTNAHDANATLDGFYALYFSVQVLTTITFGDIQPVSNVARILVLVEAIIGVFYLAILVSRLVGLYSSSSSSSD